MNPTQRTRMLTDADVLAICDELERRSAPSCKSCKFADIEEEELKTSIRFSKHLDALMTESGSIIRKTILVFGVSGLISLLVLGAFFKIRAALGM